MVTKAITSKLITSKWVLELWIVSLHLDRHVGDGNILLKIAHYQRVDLFSSSGRMFFTLLFSPITRWVRGQSLSEPHTTASAQAEL